MDFERDFCAPTNALPERVSAVIATTGIVAGRFAGVWIDRSTPPVLVVSVAQSSASERAAVLKAVGGLPGQVRVESVRFSLAELEDARTRLHAELQSAGVAISVIGVDQSQNVVRVGVPAASSIPAVREAAARLGLASDLVLASVQPYFSETSRP